MASTAFEPAGKLDQFLNVRLFLNLLLEFGDLFNRIFDTHVPAPDRRGDHFGNSVDLSIREVECPSHVFDRGLGSHRSERDDLANRIAPIKVRYVVDDLTPAPNAKIDV